MLLQFNLTFGPVHKQFRRGKRIKMKIDGPNEIEQPLEKFIWTQPLEISPYNGCHPL